MPKKYFDLAVSEDLDIKEAERLAIDDNCQTIALNRVVCDCPLTKLPSFKKCQADGVTVLKRVTVEVSDTRHLMQFGDSGTIPPQCQLIAVRPMTENIFFALCKDYQQFDIISLEASEKLPFMLRRNQVQEAITKGLTFQMCYSPALSDSSHRKIVFNNLATLFAATKGKNTIISSGCRSILFHRTPYDVISLLISLGVRQDYAQRSLSQNAKACLQRSKFIRMFKGTIERCLPGQTELFDKKLNLRRLARLQKMQAKRQQISQ